MTSAFLAASLPPGLRIYMRQPPGYAKPWQEKLVCELRKSLYGLKQAPRLFYLVMCEFLTSMGFTRCHKEYCLFVKRVGNTDDFDINSYGYSKT